MHSWRLLARTASGSIGASLVGGIEQAVHGHAAEIAAILEGSQRHVVRAAAGEHAQRQQGRDRLRGSIGHGRFLSLSGGFKP